MNVAIEITSEVEYERDERAIDEAVRILLADKAQPVEEGGRAA